MDYDSDGIPKICKTCFKSSDIYHYGKYRKWCFVYKKITSEDNTCKYWKRNIKIIINKEKSL